MKLLKELENYNPKDYWFTQTIISDYAPSVDLYFKEKEDLVKFKLSF